MSQRHSGCGGVCNSAVNLEDRGREREEQDDAKGATNFLRRSSECHLTGRNRSWHDHRVRDLFFDWS